MINNTHSGIKKVITIAMFFIIPIFANANTLKDFSVIDSNGETHSSESFKGKFVILNFWATWCPPCIEELPELVDFYDKYSDNVLILGMNYELDKSAEDITDFADGFGVSYPNVLYPQNSNIYDNIGIRALPTTIVYNTSGEEILFYEGTVTMGMLTELIFPKPN